MSLSLLTRKARSFARRSRFEQAWFLPVWLLLGASRFIILFVPFRQLAPHLGRLTGVAPWLPLLDASDTARAKQISRVVWLAACYTPWNSNCFPQAVAARFLLGVYGIPYSLFLGVSRDASNASLQAHAWVAAGPVKVCGGESFSQFTVVGCFVAPALTGASMQGTEA